MNIKISLLILENFKPSEALNPLNSKIQSIKLIAINLNNKSRILVKLPNHFKSQTQFDQFIYNWQNNREVLTQLTIYKFCSISL